MTRIIFSWLLSAKVSFSTRLLLLGLTLSIVPFTLTADALRLLIVGIRERRLLLAATVKCPAGHEVVLFGGWRCSCGVVFSGSGLSACPACGERSYLMCPCGLSVRNPLGRRG